MFFRLSISESISYQWCFTINRRVFSYNNYMNLINYNVQIKCTNINNCFILLYFHMIAAILYRLKILITLLLIAIMCQHFTTYSIIVQFVKNRDRLQNHN